MDAVFPENTEENRAQIFKLFDSLVKIGTQRYMLVSLLQEHIIDAIIEYFGQNKKFKISIYEVLIEKSKLYPFLVDIQFVETPSQLVDLRLKGTFSIILLSDLYIQ